MKIYAGKFSSYARDNQTKKQTHSGENSTPTSGKCINTAFANSYN